MQHFRTQIVYFCIINSKKNNKVLKSYPCQFEYIQQLPLDIQEDIMIRIEDVPFLKKTLGRYHEYKKTKGIRFCGAFHNLLDFMNFSMDDILKIKEFKMEIEVYYKSKNKRLW